MGAKMHLDGQRHLKTQMTLEYLHCKKPAMVRKENHCHCHLIGYNIVCGAMIASVSTFRCCPMKLSLTGALHGIGEFDAYLR